MISIGKFDATQRLTVVRRLCGQLAMSPNGVAAQSWARMSWPSSLLPSRKPVLAAAVPEAVVPESVVPEAAVPGSEKRGAEGSIGMRATREEFFESSSSENLQSEDGAA